MSFTPLPPRTEAALRAAPVTAPAALTFEGPLPPGYRRFSLSVPLTRGDLEGAAGELLSWQVHRRAGLTVRASDEVLRLGTVVQLRLGLGPLALRIPCRVTEVVDEPDRAGFTYATLPGHPEVGIERFWIEREDDGALRFSVAAVSAPAWTAARLAAPAARAVQDAFARRYLRGLGD